MISIFPPSSPSSSSFHNDLLVISPKQAPSKSQNQTQEKGVSSQASTPHAIQGRFGRELPFRLRWQHSAPKMLVRGIIGVSSRENRSVSSRCQELCSDAGETVQSPVLCAVVPYVCAARQESVARWSRSIFFLCLFLPFVLCSCTFKSCIPVTFRVLSLCARRRVVMKAFHYSVTIASDLPLAVLFDELLRLLFAA